MYLQLVTHTCKIIPQGTHIFLWKYRNCFPFHCYIVLFVDVQVAAHGPLLLDRAGQGFYRFYHITMFQKERVRFLETIILLLNKSNGSTHSHQCLYLQE